MVAVVNAASIDGTLVHPLAKFDPWWLHLAACLPAHRVFSPGPPAVARIQGCWLQSCTAMANATKKGWHRGRPEFAIRNAFRHMIAVDRAVLKHLLTAAVLRRAGRGL